MYKRAIVSFFILCLLLHGCDSDGRRNAGRIRESRAQVRAGARFLAKGDMESALRAFDRAISLRPSDWETYMSVVELLMTGERYEEAIPYIEAAIDCPRVGSRPDLLDRLWDSELYTILGDANYRLRRTGDAERAYQQAVRLNKNNSTAYNNWGYMYADLNVKLDQALKLTKRAVDLEPDNGYFVDSVGWAYFRKGDSRKALELLRKAVKLCPSDAEIRYHLGRVLEAEGYPEAALIEYCKALKLTPSHASAREHIEHLYRKCAS